MTYQNIQHTEVMPLLAQCAGCGKSYGVNRLIRCAHCGKKYSCLRCAQISKRGASFCASCNYRLDEDWRVMRAFLTNFAEKVIAMIDKLPKQLPRKRLFKKWKQRKIAASRQQEKYRELRAEIMQRAMQRRAA